MAICISINALLIQLGYPDCNRFENIDLYFHSFEIDDTYLKTVYEHSLEIGPLMHLTILEYTSIDFDNEILTDIFERGDSRVKWKVCDFIIRRKRYKKIGSWIKHTFLNRQYKQEETAPLAFAIPKIMKRDQAFDVLFQALPQHTITTIETLCYMLRIGEDAILEKLTVRVKNLDNIPDYTRELIKNYTSAAQRKITKRF